MHEPSRIVSPVQKLRARSITPGGGSGTSAGVFVHSLRDIHYAEKEIEKPLPTEDRVNREAA
jgi:hypothetical protein